MLGIRSISPVMRAIFVIGAVAALVTSITFAALNDSVSLTGNTLSTTNANLQIYDFTIPDWAETAEGFDFDDLVPGVYSDPENFYLRNNGGVDLDLGVKAENFVVQNGVAGEDITLKFEGECGDPAVEYTMAALQLGPVGLPCSPLLVGEAGDSNTFGTPGNYSFAVMIDHDAVDGPGPFDAGTFDLVFSGTQVAPSP